MARPSSTAQTVRKHMTKQEQQAREEAENALRSGLAIREDPDVEADHAAHAEFVRVVELLSSIGKNEALYEGAINRYCQLKAECAQHVRLLRAVNRRIEAVLEDDETPHADAAEALSVLKRSAQEYETLLRQKRTMLLAIEKECCMTVSGAARTVPKKPEQKANPLALALADG